MQFICQALAGPSSVTSKRLHPVSLGSVLPVLGPVDFPLPAVTQTWRNGITPRVKSSGICISHNNSLRCLKLNLWIYWTRWQKDILSPSLFPFDFPPLGYWSVNVWRKQVTHSRSNQHERGEQSITRRLQHNRHANTLWSAVRSWYCFAPLTPLWLWFLIFILDL